MTDSCSCRPRSIHLHQRGSYCGDAQHERVTDAIVRATNRPGFAAGQDWMETLAAEVLHTLAGMQRCVVPGCPFDPLFNGRCLPHQQPTDYREPVNTWGGVCG